MGDATFAAFLAGLPAPPTATAVQEIGETPELQRIRDAPRVDWSTWPDLEHLRLALTAHLKMPAGAQELKPIQAAALRAIYEHGSAVVPLRTGGGKTLISFLAPEILHARRPLLIVPAKMINSGKTHREHAKARAHWRLRPIFPRAAAKARALHGAEYAPLRVVSYEALGRVDYTDALGNWAPDLIMLDECHKAKDPKAAVTKRLARYIRSAQPAVLLETGTLTNRRLREYAHLLRWAMKDRTPLPADWHESQAWGWALDEKVPDAVRLPPGALLQLSPPDVGGEKDKDERGIARHRYARRLRSTAGVIASGDDLPGLALTARIERLAPDTAMQAAVQHLRARWETPCGQPFEQATQLWAHEREVSCDFYYRWDVPPPVEWLQARRAWSALVREVLSRSRTHDSPLAVANAIDRGQIGDGGTLAAWREVAPLFRPDEHREPVWISTQTTDRCAAWLGDVGGICWVYHVAFGQRLAERTGIPYFGAGGKCRGVAIDQHKGPAIASITAISEGFNLQELHCHNLVATTPSTNKENEQMISRTHREGGAFDEVTVTYLQTLEGDAKALDQARADALYVESTMLQPQRLCAATWIDE